MLHLPVIFSTIRIRFTALRIFASVALATVAFAAQAQTNISIPAASGAGVAATLPTGPGGHVFGINLDDSVPYGNGQLTANLISSSSTFAPQIWNQASVCGSGTTSAWIDNNSGSPQPANFWQGATFQVVSGSDVGDTGTITSSLAASGGNGVTINATFAHACSNGDQMIIRCRTALSTCAGGYTAANANFSISTSGGGNISFETTDVSPSSQSPQALQIRAAGSATGLITNYFDDTSIPGTSQYY